MDTTLNMIEKLETLRALIDKEYNERVLEQYPTLKPEIITIKPGNKYIKIDVGHSGKYMIEVSTENIYGIKGYGVVHKGHCYGNLDTINQYYWGDYTAFKKN